MSNDEPSSNDEDEEESPFVIPALSLRPRPPHAQSADAAIGIDVQAKVGARFDRRKFLLEEVPRMRFQFGHR